MIEHDDSYRSVPGKFVGYAKIEMKGLESCEGCEVRAALAPWDTLRLCGWTREWMGDDWSYLCPCCTKKIKADVSADPPKDEDVKLPFWYRLEPHEVMTAIICVVVIAVMLAVSIWGRP